MNLLLIIGFTIFNNINTILWSLPGLFCSLFGIQIYYLSGMKVSNIYNNVSYKSIINNGEPSGWILGYWFIGFINDNNNLYILIKSIEYNKIFKNNEENNILLNDDKPITFWERDGNFFNIFYNDREIKLPYLELRHNQEKIIDNIINFSNNSNNKCCITLITGPPGTGKSFIALNLCKKLLSLGAINTHLVDTHNPSDPGDVFQALYARIKPSPKEPLIIILEEIDVIIEKMLLGIPSHKLTPISIQNKIGWNSYFDKFNRGLFQHVYVLLTSNKTKMWFNQKCSSLIRPGRINLIYTLNNDYQNTTEGWSNFY